MLPYIDIPPLHVGGITLVPFGTLVALGCICGWLVARREARLRGLDPVAIDGCLVWALVPGFFMSRLFELAFYNPDLLLAQPWSLLLFWQSMSSFGGFLGGALGTIGYFRYTGRPLWPYLDCLIAGFVVGWLFGRLGCTIIHDHPGSHTSFPLAVVYPDGPRHDLGLYEFIFTVVLAFIVFGLRRHLLPPGLLLGAICVAYAPVRFLMDFLRVADPHYLGLTAGQYFSIALLAAGLVTVRVSLRASNGGRSPGAALQEGG